MAALMKYIWKKKTQNRYCIFSNGLNKGENKIPVQLSPNPIWYPVPQLACCRPAECMQIFPGGPSSFTLKWCCGDLDNECHIRPISVWNFITLHFTAFSLAPWRWKKEQDSSGEMLRRIALCSAQLTPANTISFQSPFPFVDVQRVSLPPLLLTILMKPCVTTDKVCH